jgi:hypothetical protein
MESCVDRSSRFDPGRRRLRLQVKPVDRGLLFDCCAIEGVGRLRYRPPEGLWRDHRFVAPTAIGCGIGRRNLQDLRESRRMYSLANWAY